MLSLADSIRLGSALRPQGFLCWASTKHDGRDAATCVQGAAMEGDGIASFEELYASRNPHLIRQAAEVRWPWAFVPDDTLCPAGCESKGDMAGIDPEGRIIYAQPYTWYRMMHLNDNHKWTRERIADWVEAQEIQQGFNEAVKQVAPSVNVPEVKQVPVYETPFVMEEA